MAFGGQRMVFRVPPRMQHAHCAVPIVCSMGFLIRRRARIFIEN
jgi:hypothetical protein